MSIWNDSKFDFSVCSLQKYNTVCFNSMSSELQEFKNCLKILLTYFLNCWLRISGLLSTKTTKSFRPKKPAGLTCSVHDRCSSQLVQFWIKLMSCLFLAHVIIFCGLDYWLSKTIVQSKGYIFSRLPNQTHIRRKPPCNFNNDLCTWQYQINDQLHIPACDRKSIVPIDISVQNSN